MEIWCYPGVKTVLMGIRQFFNFAVVLSIYFGVALF